MPEPSIPYRTDLHIHSCYSNDGELSPGEIFQSCNRTGINTFSITDHNSVSAHREAVELAASRDEITFIPGIEIDCSFKGTDLHLLGYHIDWTSEAFDELERLVDEKIMESVPVMVENLTKEGIRIDLDKLLERSGNKPPTAELIAELLLASPDQQSNPKLKPYLRGGARSDMPLINFYLDYFAQGKPAYVPIEHLPYGEGLNLIKLHGGIPVIAHPGLNFRGKEQCVEQLLDEGAEGLEVFNNYHSSAQVDYFASLTRKHKALMTCGSDYHGKTKPLIEIGQYAPTEGYREDLDRAVFSLLEV